MSKKIWGLPVSTPLNPAKIDPVVPDDKLANAVSAYMDANPVTPSGIGARPDTWTPTAEEVGATPASHAEDKNNPHSVTIAQIGAAPASHVENKNNPHAVTAAQIGLGNVDNTADKDKPVSTAQATAITDAKNEALTAAANAHTAANNAQTAATNAQTAANNANTAINAHKQDKNNPHAVTCEQIGAATKEYADTKTSMTLLWENASPTDAFVEQTIKLDWTPYDRILVDYSNGGSSAAPAELGMVQSVMAILWNGTITVCGGFRKNSVVSTGIKFENAQSLGLTAAAYNAADNKFLIPVRIYGIKGVIE